MAITITPLGLSGSLRVLVDNDADSTSENNVNDGAATIYAVTIDNTANAALTYLKLFNAASATLGTTAPDMILMANASTDHTYIFKTGNSFSTGLSYGAVTTGGTAGTTNPTSNVIVRIVVS